MPVALHDMLSNVETSITLAQGIGQQAAHLGHLLSMPSILLDIMAATHALVLFSHQHQFVLVFHSSKYMLKQRLCRGEGGQRQLQ